MIYRLNGDLRQGQRRGRLLRLYAHRAALVHLAPVGDAAPIDRHATQLGFAGGADGDGDGGGASGWRFVRGVVRIAAVAAVERVLRFGAVALEDLHI